MLVKDIKNGRLRKSEETRQYKNCFEELSEQDGIIFRGECIVIPAALRRDVLEVAHMGHPGKQVLRQLRLSTWWPDMTRDAGEFEESCMPCKAASGHNGTPPMTIREIPERAWQHVSADYKGPIGGQCYLHVMIDNYSRWPEVTMVKSTAFDKLESKLEEVFVIHGVPDSVTHDNGPCYNSADWKAFSRKWGFESRACTPEHPQANGIAERFMRVLVKVMHTAIATKTDPRVEGQRRLLNYRNMPHAPTGKTPAELMIRRQIRTRIPSKMKTANEAVDKQAKGFNKVINEDRKKRFDKRHRVKQEDIKIEDQILIKQEKTTTKPPFDPESSKVTALKGTQVTGKREGQTKRRNLAKVKKLRPRLDKWRKPTTKRTEDNADASDEEIDIYLEDSTIQQEETTKDRPEQATIQTDREYIGMQTEQSEQEQTRNRETERVDGTARNEHMATRRSNREKRAPRRCGQGEETENKATRASPRKRRQIRSEASKRKTQREEWKIWDKVHGWKSASKGDQDGGRESIYEEAIIVQL